MSTALNLTPITVEEARDLTDRINRTAGDLSLLLVEAHEREAWRALGYESWRAYAEGELRVSVRQAYRQVDHGRVTLALLEAIAEGDEVRPTGHASISNGAEKSTPVVEISERAARDIKPVLPAVTAEVKERVAAGEPPKEAVQAAVAAHRPARTPEPEPPAEPDNNSPDILAELEHADRRIRDLEAEIVSLSKADAATEIRALHAKFAQLNANHNSTLTTLSEVRKEAEYAKKMLAQIRKALGVERDRDIMTAIRERIA